MKEGMARAAAWRLPGRARRSADGAHRPLFFEVLRVLLAGGVTVVAESRLPGSLVAARLERLSELAQLRIVQCHVDQAVSFDRAVLARLTASTTGGSRRQHARKQSRGLARAFDSFDRSRSPHRRSMWTRNDGYAPDLAAIVAFVSRPIPQAAQL